MSDFAARFRVEADPSGFVRGMDVANTSANNLKKGLAGIGLDLKGLGSGILGAGLVRMFMSAADQARQVAAEAAKTGEHIDWGTAALVRFGDTLAKVKALAFEGAKTVATFTENVGLSLASKVYGVEAAVLAAQKMAREANAAADKVNAEKIANAEKELAKFRAENTFKRASDEEKVNILLARQLELLKQQNEAGRDTEAGVKLQLEIERNRAEIADANTRIEKERAKVSAELAKMLDEAVTKAEEEGNARRAALVAEQDQIIVGYEREAQLKAQTAELEAQERKLSKLLALSEMMNGAGGSVFRQASDAELQERLRRSQQSVINQQNSLVGKDGSVGAMIVGADIARLQVEIANIRSELATRAQLRRDFELGGEAMARRNFKGDPLAFDDEFARLVADTRSAKEIQAETLSTLRRMEDRQKTGAPVMVMNK